MINVLVAEDYDVVREGLKAIINGTNDIRVTGATGTSKETLKALHEDDYDVLILDLIMPDISGLGLLIQMKQEEVLIPTLVYTAKSEQQFGIASIQSGATGYITKDDQDRSKLLDGIRKLHRGGRAFSNELTARMQLVIEDPDSLEPHEKLSPREFEVFYMVASGQSILEIADTLKLADRTIRTFYSRIKQKTDLDTPYKIIQYAFRHGIVE